MRIGSRVTKLTVGWVLSDGHHRYTIMAVDGENRRPGPTRHNSVLTLREEGGIVITRGAGTIAYTGRWSIVSEPSSAGWAPTALVATDPAVETNRSLRRAQSILRANRPSPAAGPIAGSSEGTEMNAFIMLNKVTSSDEYEGHDSMEEFDEEGTLPSPTGDAVVLNVGHIRCFYPRKDGRPGTRITLNQSKGLAVTEDMRIVLIRIAEAAPAMASEFIELTKIRTDRFGGNEREETVRVNRRTITMFYPRKEGRVGTRIVFKDGGAFPIRETADVLTAILHDVPREELFLPAPRSEDAQTEDDQSEG